MVAFTVVLLLLTMAADTSRGFRLLARPALATGRQTRRLQMASDGPPPPANTTVEDKLAAALWFDGDAFVKSISVPNLLVGAFLGAVLSVAALLTPFIVSPDYDGFNESPPAEYMVPSTVASEAPIPAETAIARSVELFDDILTDLHLGFVDPINPQKLFETAVRRVGLPLLCQSVPRPPHPPPHHSSSPPTTCTVTTSSSLPPLCHVLLNIPLRHHMHGHNF
jgi:hypothetical protein